VIDKDVDDISSTPIPPQRPFSRAYLSLCPANRT